MYSHVSLAVTEIDRARTFYDAILEPLGYPRRVEWDEDDHSAYAGEPRLSFWIQVDVDSSPPSGRQHVAFDAPSRSAVDAFHENALEAGGEDDGSPGPRPEYGEHYYAAYVVDLDGNRIEAAFDRPER